MKAPLALTFVILAAGSFWGVRENRSLAILREKHRLVVTEAALLGVSADLSKPVTPTKHTKRQREDSRRKVSELTNTLVAFAKEMKEAEKSGEPPAQGMQHRIMELIDGMLALNAEELKLLIAEMRGRTDMDDDMRKGMIGFSIMMLAQQHPQTALAIFTESSDLLDKDMMSGHVLSSALTQWAKDQPLAALEWIKKNADKHPDLVNDEARLAVVAGAARTDFALAFQLAAELKLSPDEGSLIERVARQADTPERQAEFLAALRKQAANTADKQQAEKLMAGGLGSLFSQVAESGYDKSMAWMKSANLTDAETLQLAADLNYHTTKGETGKWLEWISSRQAEGAGLENPTRELVRNWTQQDYKAAGEWLAKSDAGPLKEAATLSYLETVAPYDPEVAAQWAGTLSGEKQQDAMKRIHAALKQKDTSSAEDFAKRHGLPAE